MIANKLQAGVLARRHAFGNTLRTWWTLADFRAGAPRDGRYCVRANTPGGPVCYDLSFEEVQGGMVNEMAPDHALLLQGEVTEVGWELRYSTVPGLHMREAMLSPDRAFGLAARLLLQRAMTPSSYSDLLALFDVFPEHVVEFSSYAVLLGDLKGRNTLIWEVRSY